jgi:hypothetical protein
MGNVVWLADVLRAAGLKVVESHSWQSAGRGPMGDIRGVLLHHTAGPRSGNSPSLRIVRDGRGPPNPLAGPLSQLFLARDGTFHVLASGRCNHAGAGRWQNVTAGNSELIGIEAENAGDGRDPWPPEQMDAYARGVAAILLHIKADAVMAAGHKEYAMPKGRKVDPAFDMVAFRQRVEGLMAGDKAKSAVPRTKPDRAMLRKGDQGDSVVMLQGLLGVRPDGAFGPQTHAAVVAFQRAKGLTPDGLVGPKTWAALLEGKETDGDG